MVRADDQSGRKTGGHSRKKSSAGKSGPEPYNAPLWPCEINGCGKQFVREADLRRHQRTTKVHANPNYVCGECGASFTRTDALKRHEKSKSHVARTPSLNSSMFIEDSTTPTSAEAKATSTSSELSTRSRSSRSLSPGPSRQKEKERRERERRLGDRELPPLRAPTSSRYYRPHTAMITPYEQPPAPSNSQPAVSVPRLQTHSSSLNAILASPISTPRLHPANWSLPSSGQSNVPVHNNNGYAQAPPSPSPSLSKLNSEQYVTHYQYPHSPPHLSQLLAPEQSTPPSREPLPPSPNHKDHTSREQLVTCHTVSTVRTDSSLKGNENATSSMITTIRRRESPSLTTSSLSAPLTHFAAPPIAASKEPPLTLATLADDDSNSSDSDGTEEPDEEVDELEPTDSETELVELEGATDPNPADVQPENSVPTKAVTVQKETEDKGVVTAGGHSIPDIDIEACIDPVATGITEEEVKAAMDDMRKQELEQQAEQQQQQQQLRQGKTENKRHTGRLGTLSVGMGIGIRASSTGVDHDGSPFLSEMVLSSPSSTLVASGTGSVRSPGGHTRHGGHTRSCGSGVSIPGVHRSPGSRRGPRTQDSDDECRSPSSLLGDPHGDLGQDFHHHHPSRQHRSYESHDGNEGTRSHLGESGDVDMKMVYDVVDADVGGDVGVGGRLLEKVALQRVKANAMDVDDFSDSNSLHDRDRHRRHDAYGDSSHHPSLLDRSPSSSPLEHYHHTRHHRHPHSHSHSSHSIIDEEDEDGQHMLHRHAHHLRHQHHPTELLAHVTMPL